MYVMGKTTKASLVIGPSHEGRWSCSKVCATADLTALCLQQASENFLDIKIYENEQK